MTIISIKRALLSVSNKQGLVKFAKELIDLGIEIVSTGGTSQALTAANIPHQQVEDLTGYPEMLGGRVKTLHPKIHGGILGKRDEHAIEAAQHDIAWIDLVVVNFYPFASVVEKNLPWEKIVEYIDIGGPTMVRAAAKNFAWVGVVVDPDDYAEIIAALKQTQGLDFNLRSHLATKAFSQTCQYDALIQDYFFQRLSNQNREAPNEIQLLLEKQSEMRYGENPHQKAYSYLTSKPAQGIFAAYQHQGKPLSYNNILDSEAAINCVAEFKDPACVIVKHANPCGVATAVTVEDACLKAQAADATSAFGGIVALNKPCTRDAANILIAIFTEVIIAPAFTLEALAVFATKPNLRILEMPVTTPGGWEFRYVRGGFLMQESDHFLPTLQDLKVVTRSQPSEQALQDMLFGWRVLKHLKSNAILIAKNNQTVGIGAGQVSRIDAVDIAIRKSGSELAGAILASDAFFPFRDSIDKIAHSGITSIIQPGGSIRDEEVISACNEYKIAMVLTGKRCFKH